MRNLISANLYRLVRCKLFYFMLLAQAAFEILLIKPSGSGPDECRSRLRYVRLSYLELSHGVRFVRAVSGKRV